MKLLTQSIQLALPRIYRTDEIPLNDKIVICKFFTPWSFWTWFVFEGESENDLFGYTDSDDYIFYGMVHGFEKEMGYFRLAELESIRGPGGSMIEKDQSIFKVRYADCAHSLCEKVG